MQRPSAWLFVPTCLHGCPTALRNKAEELQPVFELRNNSCHPTCPTALLRTVQEVEELQLAFLSLHLPHCPALH